MRFGPISIASKNSTSYSTGVCVQEYVKNIVNSEKIPDLCRLGVYSSVAMVTPDTHRVVPGKKCRTEA